MDPMDLFDRASAWTATKVDGAKGALDKQTPCDDWKVRDLINHLISTNRYFQSSARGEQAKPPQGKPKDLMGPDPLADYERERHQTMEAFGNNGGKEKMQGLGMAFVEQLVHGWDLAQATGQKAEMPPDLAEAAFQIVDGKMPPEQRGEFFGPEVSVPDAASAQEKLLAYSGRKP
jgi:uncharacterized protein (TIGR03086 family)